VVPLCQTSGAWAGDAYGGRCAGGGTGLPPLPGCARVTEADLRAGEHDDPERGIAQGLERGGTQRGVHLVEPVEQQRDRVPGSFFPRPGQPPWPGVNYGFPVVCPLFGSLPLPEDVRERDVLRTVGAVYQFRHAILQDHLAGQAIRNSTTPTVTPSTLTD
jgi:hypothetical protein